jgi:hypothetical protein
MFDYMLLRGLEKIWVFVNFPFWVPACPGYEL